MSWVDIVMIVPPLLALILSFVYFRLSKAPVKVDKSEASGVKTINNSLYLALRDNMPESALSETMQWSNKGAPKVLRKNEVQTKVGSSSDSQKPRSRRAGGWVAG